MLTLVELSCNFPEPLNLITTSVLRLYNWAFLVYLFTFFISPVCMQMYHNFDKSPMKSPFVAHSLDSRRLSTLCHKTHKGLLAHCRKHPPISCSRHVRLVRHMSVTFKTTNSSSNYICIGVTYYKSTGMMPSNTSPPPFS